MSGLLAGKVGFIAVVDRRDCQWGDSVIKRWWWVLLVTVLFVVTPASVGATAHCEFILGFATLKAAIDEAEGREKVGACLENQRFAANGNAEQRTTGGLLVWRKQDNFTAFTDGYRTWVNGPQGLQVRLNTESFAWEPPRHYRGVALGGREDNADLRAWIDQFGTLGHGENSYDHWVSIGKPRDQVLLEGSGVSGCEDTTFRYQRYL